MKKSLIVKRSIVVGGHKTSVSLEDEFWGALKKIAAFRRVTLSDLVGSIDSQRQHGNLSSAVRLFVLNHYRERVEVPDVWPLRAKRGPAKAPTSCWKAHGQRPSLHHDLAGEVIRAIPSGLILVGWVVAAPAHFHPDAAFLKT
jgi:predicted DNA-binding ribbon-helix-helix protein